MPLCFTPPCFGVGLRGAGARRARLLRLLRPLRALLPHRRGATPFGADSSAVAVKLGSGVRTIVTTKSDVFDDYSLVQFWNENTGSVPVTMGAAFAAIFDDGSAVSSALLMPRGFGSVHRPRAAITMHLQARCRNGALPACRHATLER